MSLIPWHPTDGCNSHHQCDPMSSVYMVPGTEEQSESDTSEEQSESDTWASNRWMRLTASVAKRVVSVSPCVDDFSGINVFLCYMFV